MGKQRKQRLAQRTLQGLRFIKRFLAAIPLGELEEEEKKGQYLLYLSTGVCRLSSTTPPPPPPPLLPLCLLQLLPLTLSSQVKKCIKSSTRIV
ncbi:hypothetical protein GBA52_001053 [Prunus armeniaca]|nr:hypothetical protein GBA52_001053 [Prunus armeniaca]